MQLELRNLKGEVIGTIDIAEEKVKERLNLSISSISEAKLAETKAQLKEPEKKTLRLGLTSLRRFENRN